MNRTKLACSLLAATLFTGVAHAAPKPPVVLNGGGSSLAFPTYAADFAAFSTSKKNKDLFSYEAVGSGAGQNAFLNNDITYFEPVSGTNTHGYAAGALTYGTIVGTQVDYGASDAFLLSTQLTNAATGSYALSNVDGPLIQVPTIGTPITIPYNQSGTPSPLVLTDAQLCGVLSGKITDWHSLVPTIAAGTTINVTYRSDSSGTTFLLTQHLHAACTSANSNFSIPVPITKTFATEFGTVPSNFTAESGSGGVASHMTSTPGSFGYLSPDYTAIAPNSANTTSLQVASLVNAVDGKTYAPSVAATTQGLVHPGAGSTNPSPPATLAAAQNPLNWVPAVPQTTQGYPIVGYTTIDASTCYSAATRGTLLIDILKDIYKKGSNSYAVITTNNGFVPLANSGAAKFYTAIESSFLSNKSGYNLNIDNATTCAGLAGR